MTSRETWALILAGLGLGGLAAYGASSPKTAAAGAPGSPTGTATIGPGGSVLQTRPIPAWTALSPAGQQAYVNIMQQELGGPLGYNGVTANGNWNDPGTAAAITSFLNANRQAATAYGYTGGANEYADIVAIMKAVDDIARGNTGADQASDYVAPSSGLMAPAVAPRPVIYASGAVMVRRSARIGSSPRVRVAPNAGGCGS